jgi:hypothetical protein
VVPLGIGASSERWVSRIKLGKRQRVDEWSPGAFRRPNGGDVNGNAVAEDCWNPGETLGGPLGGSAKRRRTGLRIFRVCPDASE